MRIAFCLLALLLLAGCGDEEMPARAHSTSLLVTVDADGDGAGAPKQARVSCDDDSCAGVPRSAFQPVNPTQACTDIFGGPQTASVEGTLRGKAVSARFSRRNGCEIKRWEAASPLLDRVSP